TVRRRRRRGYRPGSGRRDDLPAAPVVYELRLAHLRGDDRPGPDEPDPEAGPWPDDGEPGRDEDDRLPGTGRSPSAAEEPTVGEDAQRIALAAAGTRGLGLTGPGALDALRALLLTLLAGGSDDHEDPDGVRPAVRLLVPRDDLATVLGPVDNLPGSVQVHDTLDDAVDALEDEVIARATHPTVDGLPVLVLVARPDGEDARLQAVLDNGSQVGVTALLLGQWRSGSTLHVRDDGVVTATGPGPCAALRGHRLLTLDRDAAGRIVELLHEAATAAGTPDGSPPAESPDTTGATAETPLEVGPDAGDERAAAVSGQARAVPASPAERDPVGGPAEVGVRPIRLVVLGPPRVLWHPGTGSPDHGDDRPVEAVEITGRLQPRARELLVHLALHPDGAAREAVSAALWPDSALGRITNSLNTALTRLRQTLTQVTGGEVGDIVRNADGRFALDPDLVEVDYWRFDAAVIARRAAGTDEERTDADQLVVDAYGGELAEGTPYPWVETAREAVRRDAIDSAASLARALVPRDPQRTLDLLEIARAFDPLNELIYRDIMRLQSRLDRPDAISRTLALLTARLGEIGDQPHPETIDLAHSLQRRGGAPGTDHDGVAAGTAARTG
ncbi:MAG: transcriptional regulator, partial [Pseudonocardia sp.]|nr:transcriptional regulator [Pseudonocardia sp.]